MFCGHLLQVLSIYPSTIRRRILRHLYQAPMQNCYLFADCKQKFLDALLAAARVELFMPQVPYDLMRAKPSCSVVPASRLLGPVCSFPIYR